VGLFGKNKVQEVVAAAQFVQDILIGVHKDWPTITGSFRPLMKLEVQKLDSPWAQFEFALASLATQVQALPNLLPADQTKRMRQHIISCLSSPELGTAGVEGLQAYEAAWARALQAAKLPHEEVASILFDRLDLQSSVELGGTMFKAPLLLMALAGQVVTFRGAWWKTFLSTNRLVA
jgi:hypothetical protein